MNPAPGGGRIVARAFTRDGSLGRRLVHADLPAMLAAAEEPGRRPRVDPCPWRSTSNPA